MTNLADFIPSSIYLFIYFLSGLSSQLPAEDRVHVVVRGDFIGAGDAQA